MNTPDLPDDPRDWPTDPFAVLGVPRGASDADLKRAYTRLIKRYKPEHAPEQFRRVREAYETCLEQSRWFRFDPSAEPDPAPAPPPPEPEAAPLHEPAAAAPDAPEPDEPPPAPRPRHTDEAERLWELAAGGNDADAYHGLKALHDALPDRPDLSLRLYWLLALNPGLDPAADRHHWLAAGLRRAGLRGPAAELYRRELDADPHAALGGPYRDLTGTPARSDDLLAVARWRLAAAGRCKRFPAAAADLTALRDRLRTDHEADWLGLVVAAHDWCAWDRDEPLYPLCVEELARLRHLELSHAYHFDRREEADFLAAEWQMSRDVFLPPEFLRLARVGWAGGGEVTARDVAPAAAAVAADPGRALGKFDRMRRERGFGLVVLVGRILERYRRLAGLGNDPPFPPDLLRGAARAATRNRRVLDYALLRTELLEYLSAEAIDPEEVADACDHDPDHQYRYLAASLRGDFALRAVWVAVRIHRG